LASPTPFALKGSSLKHRWQRPAFLLLKKDPGAFLKNLFENHHPLFKNRLWPLSEKHFLPEILLPNVDFSRKFWRKKQNIRHFKTFHERFFKVSRFVHTVFKLLTLQNDFLSYFTID